MLVTLTSDFGTNTPGELRTVLSQAKPGDTITFAPQIYNQTIALNPKLSQLNLNPGAGNSLTINGTGSGITIQGGGNTRIFEVQSGTATINGLGLTQGKVTDQNGGAILVDKGATLNATGDTFTNNQAAENTGSASGGAIEDDGTANITNCAFSGNTAISSGGAINASGDSTNTVNLTVSGSNFNNNQAEDAIGGSGGAIESTAAVTNIQSSTFGSNTAGSLGGAIGYGAGYNSTFAVNLDYFTGNKAGTTNGGEGGAIAIVNNVNSGTVTMSVTNSTFFANKAISTGSTGGAVSIQNTTAGTGSAKATFINDTFFSNTSDGQGGGLWEKAVNTGTGTNTLELTSLTVNQNSAFSAGGGVYLDTVQSVAVDNNIFDGNKVTMQGYNGPLDLTLANAATLNDKGYNLVGTTDTMFDPTKVPSDILNNNSGLAGALAQNGAPAGYPPTLALVGGPGLKSGDNTLASRGGSYAVDERGLFRPKTGASRGAEDPNATAQPPQ